MTKLPQVKHQFQVPVLEYPVNNNHITGLKDIKLASLHYAASIACSVNAKYGFVPHERGEIPTKGMLRNLTNFAMLTNVAAYYAANAYLFIETLPSITPANSSYLQRNQFYGLSKSELEEAKSMTYQAVYQQGIANFEAKASKTGQKFKIKKLSPEDQLKLNFTMYLELLNGIKYGYIPHCYTFAYCVNSSQFHFNREFKTLVGTTINDYIKKCIIYIKSDAEENLNYSRIIKVIKKRYSLHDVQSVLFSEEAHLNFENMKSYVFALGSETYHIMKPFLVNSNLHDIKMNLRYSLMNKLTYLNEGLTNVLENSSSSTLSSSTSTNNSNDKNDEQRFRATGNRVTKKRRKNMNNHLNGREIICCHCNNKILYCNDLNTAIKIDQQISSNENNFIKNNYITNNFIKDDENVDNGIKKNLIEKEYLGNNNNNNNNNNIKAHWRKSFIKKISSYRPPTMNIEQNVEINNNPFNEYFDSSFSFNGYDELFENMPIEQEKFNFEKILESVDFDISNTKNIIDSSNIYCASGETSMEETHDSIGIINTLTEIEGSSEEIEKSVNNSEDNKELYLITPRTMNSNENSDREVSPKDKFQEQNLKPINTDDNPIEFSNDNFMGWNVKYSNLEIE
ncbi:hypothetical protein TPHA_0C04370 [Tetrapisispora phaffii CBS 4417]|uniref:Uncharacterized protein n=1 Tax=Tetrapisispora phaffii (strain ATCC 24235 / CBS 4417 / NBRC 1672 / NRRL Y-8282 / UCD 70-5) TaxID=1071381 RepID=G8BQS5_TETPH|nr:hypothetical protein TPHA_0C04370 [Tetrapisispora phaffii CBS 4417]CCE62587.1 hypothetical protein TPHA_0C04370 [Tetrapisispora phaffii CBS 4417]